MKVFLGQRQIQLVNDKLRKHWSWERLSVVLVIVITFVLIALLYSSNDYVFGSEVRWARLSYSLDRENWDQEIPVEDDFWIRGELDVPSNEVNYNALFFGLSASYDVFWDGRLIGQNGDPEEAGRIHYIQPLGIVGVAPGLHVVELRAHSERSLFEGDLFAGVILGDGSQFAIQPVLQFSSVAMTLGLLLIIGLSLFIKGGKRDAMWVIVALVMYLVINYLKTLYNYPYTWHEYRLVAYALVILFLALTLINYAFAQSSVIRFRKIVLPILTLIFAAYFYMFSNYSEAKYYLLFTAPVLSILLISSRYREFKSWVLIGLLLVTSFVTWYIEVGLLMVLGYVAILLIEYFEDEEVEEEEVVVTTHLTASHKGEKRLLALSEICAIKGANNYAEIILDNQNHYLSDKSLGKIMQEVPNHFVRIHKSYIVDFSKAQGLKSNESGGKILCVSNGMEFPVGRTYVKSIKERLI
ncbi:LytR/AlgR family response regulator transcription factor [Reichenbachiella ulvae]|uniref:LytTR family transcriptional regulator n=1 Tax=Reichenbachiella ulvae TaxID=2980104 RepID=A0ABT3CPL6_9BACT|nr:LytTR family transcriptional regulator [Reichenbachiella ulvae]MCV9385676.1 LytTR family transcriptional regulator [Reichenbachiella ulvae]